ncbi:MAG: energy transducer TonB [Alphaproteobacteria bacterium]|nr:energy transducer TonB [Alphaproteobacteria bacterium]
MISPTENATSYWIKPHQWAFGLCIAVVLHAGVAGAVLWQDSPPPGAKSAGTGGVEVSLGPIGGAPGSEVQAVSETNEIEPVEAVAEPVTQAEVPPEAQPIEPEPQEIQEAVEVVKTAEPILMAEAQEVVEVRTEVPPPKPQMPKTPEPKRPTTPAKPELPLPTETQAVQSPTPTNTPTTQTASAPSDSGAQGKAGTKDSREAGDANAQTAGGLPGSTADYMATLQAWLARHKEYPRSAQKRGQEGTALLYFVIDRNGHVIEHHLQKSSGYRVLDREVSAMIERAQPLPKIPDDMPMQQLQLVLPVQFFLRQ